MSAATPALRVQQKLHSLLNQAGHNRTKEHWASNRKVSKSWFDSRCSSASLCPRERHLMLFPILGPSSLLVVIARPRKTCKQNNFSVGVVW